MDKNKPEGCSCKSQLGFYVLCIYNNLEWTKTSPRAAHAEASLASIYFEYIYNNNNLQSTKTSPRAAHAKASLASTYL